MRSELNFRN